MRRTDTHRRAPWRRPAVLLPVAALVVLGAAVYLWLGRDGGGPAETEATAAVTEQVVTAEETTLRQTVAAEGTIEAEETSDLAFDVSGTITEVLVGPGEAVTTGQVLATIDTAELDAALLQAQSDLAEAEASLSEIEADDDASDAAVDARSTQVTTASAAVTAAEEALASATLTSPIDGTVATVGYTDGQVLGSGGTSATSTNGSASGAGPGASTSGSTAAGASSTGAGIQIVSTGRYVVTVEVDATEVDQIELDQVALVTPTTSSSSSQSSGGFGPPGMGGSGGPPAGFGGFGGGAGTGEESAAGEAAGDQVEGVVSSVAAVATTSSGVATFAVEVTVEGSAEEFFPGAVAEVEVVYAEVADAVTVPSLAISRVDGQSTVTVADGDDREERTVTTGDTSGTSIQIVEGLAAGESVVVEMPSFGRGGGATGEGAPGADQPAQAPPGMDAMVESEGGR